MVTSLLQQRGDVSPFGDSDSLVMSGRLESIAVVDLAAFLEERFGVDFARIGFDQEDFETVDRIVAVVVRETQRAA